MKKQKTKKKTELCSRLFNYDSCSVISWKTNYTDTCEGQLSGAASIREPVIIVIIIVVIYLEWYSTGAGDHLILFCLNIVFTGDQGIF